MSRLRQTLTAAVALLTIGLAGRADIARASCGSATCPLDALGHEAGRSRFSLDVSYQFIDQDQVRVGSRQAGIGELPSAEDEVRTRNQSVTFLGRAALTKRWSFTASIPVVNRLHRHIANGGNEPEDQEWSFSGLGDLSVMGHFSPPGLGDGDALHVTFQAGAKLPTGRSEVPELDGEQPEPTVRPGTGSTDGILGIHVMKMVEVPTFTGLSAMLPVFAGVEYRVNGAGTEDYRVGNELTLAAGANYPVSRRLELLSQLNARFREKDDIGETDATRDNTGGRWVFLSPGLRVVTGPGLSIYSYFQLPLYQRVNRIGLTAPYNLMAGVSWVLSR